MTATPMSDSDAFYAQAAREYLMGCEHRWVRCPDRDRIQGPMPDRRVGKTHLVLYCEKCATDITKIIDHDAADGAV